MPDYTEHDNSNLLKCVRADVPIRYTEVCQAYYDGNLQPAIDAYMLVLRNTLGIPPESAEGHLEKMLNAGCGFIKEMECSCLALSGMHAIYKIQCTINYQCAHGHRVSLDFVVVARDLRSRNISGRIRCKDKRVERLFSELLQI